MPNDEMREFWNSDQSESWVRAQSQYDAMLQPFGEAVLDAAAARAGERLVDVGCGSGALSRAAASMVGERGSVVGLDISEPMVQRARDLAAELPQVRFECCDAQTADLSGLGADLVVSRFGVMFFDDPVVAFTNLARAVSPGGRLTFACWRTAPENEWVMVPMGAVVPIVGVPDLPGPGAPGPFQMGDAAFVHDTLAAAGWDAVEVRPFDCGVRLGGALDVDEAVRFLVEDSMGRRMLEGKPEELKAEAAAAVRETLAPHAREGEGVVLGAAAWLVTAHLPK